MYIIRTTIIKMPKNNNIAYNNISNNNRNNNNTYNNNVYNNDYKILIMPI